MRIAVTSVALLIFVLRTQMLEGNGGQAMAAAASSDAAALDERSDRIEDQENAINAVNSAAQDLESAISPTPRPFVLIINTPVYYNSNPAEIPSPAPTAFEGNPEIELNWRQNLTSLPLQFSFRLGADADRYANLPEAAEDQTFLSLKASYHNADDDQKWAPFISYKATLLFGATFNPWTETRNDLALGIDKSINLNGSFRQLPASGRSRVDARWVLGMSIYIQRRLRSPGPDSIALYAVPSATFLPTKEWSVSMFVNLRSRWFDRISSGATMISRRDFEIHPLLTIAYDPTDLLSGRMRLQHFSGGPLIALQVGFERRSSNVANRSWNQWTIGPVLTAAWRF
jgi:hypothetical protein